MVESNLENWHSHIWKMVQFLSRNWQFLSEFKMCIHFDPATTLFKIYPTGILVQLWNTIHSNDHIWKLLIQLWYSYINMHLKNNKINLYYRYLKIPIICLK